MKKNPGRKQRRKQRRKTQRTFPKYVAGTLKLSAVSEAIKRDHGTILSRRERKRFAKQQGVAFVAYPNK